MPGWIKLNSDQDINLTQIKVCNIASYRCFEIDLVRDDIMYRAIHQDVPSDTPEHTKQLYIYIYIYLFLTIVLKHCYNVTLLWFYILEHCSTFRPVTDDPCTDISSDRYVPLIPNDTIRNCIL